MATIKYRELRRRYELEGADKTVAHLSEALREKHLAADDFSIRCLAEALVTTRGGACIGHEWVREYCDPRGGRLLLEAGDGVDTTAFSNITGQVIYSKILDAYQHPEFVLSGLVQTVPTRLSGEKIPGIGRMGDQAAQVDEGMPYESVGFGEEFIETPPTAKRGFIVPVTKEAVFFDRTNLILSRAAEVGEFLGLNKEKRIADVVIGAVNNYKRNGTSLNTYLTSGAWINALSGNELLDWTAIDNAEQLWADMTDPNTGEPILVSGKSLLVMPAKRHTTNRIINATEVSEATGSATLTSSDNPVGGGQYTARASVIAYNRIQSELGESATDAKKWWFLGDFPKAFAYMENWPITVTQAPENSEADFNQDIVIRFKASERGAAAVLDPRFVIKSTG